MSQSVGSERVSMELMGSTSHLRQRYGAPSIKMDEDLIYEGLGDENFLAQARSWKPDAKAKTRASVAAKLRKLDAIRRRRRR